MARDRISPKVLDRALQNLLRLLRECGVDTTGWVVEHGSTTNGRTWRLYRETATGAQHETDFPSYLGSTPREAWLTLRAYGHGAYSLHQYRLTHTDLDLRFDT